MFTGVFLLLSALYIMALSIKPMSIIRPLQILTYPAIAVPAATIISVQTKERLIKRFGVSEIFAHNVQEMLIYEVSTIDKDWKKVSRNYEAKCLQAFEIVGDGRKQG